MDEVVKALALPFVAGFVVQRLLEILDPITVKLVKDANTKKIVLGLVSLGIGCALCAYAHIKLFHILNTIYLGFRDLPGWLDTFASGIFVSAGTEGFNSLMKFANYKKEASKAEAAKTLKATDQNAIKMLNP